jgi:hypothetical protein
MQRGSSYPSAYLEMRMDECRHYSAIASGSGLSSKLFLLIKNATLKMFYPSQGWCKMVCSKISGYT